MGCDGAVQKEYKQKFSNPNLTDKNLFTTLVPLQMFYIDNSKKNIL